MSVAAFIPVVGSSSVNLAHPLDPLSVDEIKRACELLLAIKKLGPEIRFAVVQLHEPTKASVLAFRPGDALERCAFLMVFDSRTGETHEAVVNLTLGTVVSWVHHATETSPYGQPPVLVEDFFNCADIVKADEGWRNAVKRRGLTDEDIKLLSRGSLG
jgi:primary-amine oxidase